MVLTDHSKYQLILRDYFQVNDTATEIAAMATELIGWLNNHGKVHIIFDTTQADISKDCFGFVKILS